jgi:hypothetical protein
MPRPSQVRRAQQKQRRLPTLTQMRHQSVDAPIACRRPTHSTSVSKHTSNATREQKARCEPNTALAFPTLSKYAGIQVSNPALALRCGSGEIVFSCPKKEGKREKWHRRPPKLCLSPSYRKSKWSDRIVAHRTPMQSGPWTLPSTLAEGAEWRRRAEFV